MKSLHYILIASGLMIILFANSCKKQEYIDPRPNFTTGDTSQIGETSATITGRLIKLNGGAIQKSGHVWSSLNDVPDLKINEGSTVLNGFTADSSSYSSLLSNLKPNATYYVRGYMERDNFTFYGDIVVFKTSKEKVLQVVTGIDSLKTFSSSFFSGYILDLGKSSVTAYGHVWSTTNTNPTTADTKTNLGSLTTIPKYFLSTASNLVPATTYYFRAYGINSQGTFYGSVKSFITGTAPIPAVTTNTIGGTGNIITVNGTVTTNGVPAATEHGFVYSKTNTTPTISDAHTSQGVPGAAPFNFATSLTGLDYSTTYYVRAYATSTAGTFYGAVLSLATAVAPVPVVTTTSIAGSGNMITVNGTLTTIGIPAATQHGFVYSKTNTTPTITDAHTSQGVPGIVPYYYTATLTGLDYSSTYYVRAYATSTAGTFYGAVLNRTTGVANTLGTVTTNYTTVSGNQITVNSTVTFIGVPIATQHGVVYSASNSSPTLADAHTSLGTPGTAPYNYNSTLSNLSYSALYYVRAYITNAAGTFYGAILTRTTGPAQIPVVTTNSADNPIGTNTIAATATINSPGSFSIINYGFVYSETNANPTTADNYLTFNNPLSSFPYNYSGQIVGLAGNRTYYIRAFARSAAGTAYGSVYSVGVSIIH
ncbi:MAG: hypothetical protein ABIP30_17235 [Ferruginibacter sp.]